MAGTCAALALGVGGMVKGGGGFSRGSLAARDSLPPLQEVRGSPAVPPNENF